MRLRQYFLDTLWMLVVIIPPSILFGAFLSDGHVTWAVIRDSVGTAAIIAMPIFVFEVYYLTERPGAAWRRLPLAIFISVRFLIWGTWIVLGYLTADQIFQISPSDSLLTAREFWWTIGFSYAVSALISLAMSIGQLLGPGVFKDLILGRYYRPRTEEMAVAFIDLKGSTALAERVGPETFFQVLSRFAYQVSDVVRHSGGRIYDYVGDEVIVTWSAKHAADLTPAAASLVTLKRRMDALSAEWQAKYGHAAGFRASLHVGPVVVGEIGNEKRAIALLGDTMNVGSRLEQAARDLDEDLVCSVDAARRIGGFLGGELKPLAPVTLKGKSAPMVVVALRSLSA